MLTAQRLVEKRRYWIVVAFVVAAVFTPPDLLSQVTLVLPLLALYEAVIAFLRWLEVGE